MVCKRKLTDYESKMEHLIIQLDKVESSEEETDQGKQKGTWWWTIQFSWQQKWLWAEWCGLQKFWFRRMYLC